MKRVQFIHQLNNTELGKTGMADCYLSIERALSLYPLISNIKDDGTPYHFSMFFRFNNKEYNTFRYECNTEQRIYGFGKLFRAVNAQAGDLVVIDNVDGKLFVDIKKYDNVIVFFKQGAKGSVQVLNTDRLNYLLDKEIDTFIDNRLCKFKLVFKGRKKKRSDAKTETDFYTIFINGIDFITQYPRDTYYRLIMGDGANVFLPSNKDKLIIVDF